MIEKDNFNPSYAISFLRMALDSKGLVPKLEIARVASLLARHQQLPIEQWVKLHDMGARIIREGSPACFADRNPDHHLDR
jgi:hypothetical protein